MSSESEDETTQIPPRKELGMCEACNAKPARYTCPRCEVKTCGLSCLNLHKRELQCDGVRDKTKYIPLVNMTKMDLMNDYYFLEECTKFVEDRKRDPNKRYTRYNKNLPSALFRLRAAANDRKTTLRFLLQNFTKRQQNTSQLDFKSGTIFWRVQWCFPNGNEAILFADDRVSENTKLYDAVDKYLNPATNESSTAGTSKLTQFQSRGIAGIQLLLKAEGIKRCRNRFFPLEVNKKLSECLAGKTVVEYPTIYVVLKDQLEEFNVVESDDDIESETRQYNNYINQNYSYETARETQKAVATDVLEGQLDQMEIDRKHQHKRQRLSDEKAPKKTVQLNFLFNDEGLANELSSDTDQGALTEEEYENSSAKPSKAVK